MSTFICKNNLCNFTRIDTDGYAINPPYTYYTDLPKFYDGDLTRQQLIQNIGDQTKAPWTDPKNQDFLGEGVALSRDYYGSLLNPFEEYSTYGPTGTEWALLPENKTFAQVRCELKYSDFEGGFMNYDPSSILGKPGIVHLIEDDIFYNIKFSSWTLETYDSSAPGGGFSYTRSKQPITLPANAPPCAKCQDAVATIPVLQGAIDDTLVSVGIAGVTPSTAKISIKAVSQDHEPTSQPNAVGLGKSTVMLRRTRIPDLLTAVRYTVYFDAATKTSNCTGSVAVCVPVAGFPNCDESPYGYDASRPKAT